MILVSGKHGHGINATRDGRATGRQRATSASGWRLKDAGSQERCSLSSAVQLPAKPARRRGQAAGARTLRRQKMRCRVIAQGPDPRDSGLPGSVSFSTDATINFNQPGLAVLTSSMPCPNETSARRACLVLLVRLLHMRQMRHASPPACVRVCVCVCRASSKQAFACIAP